MENSRRVRRPPALDLAVEGQADAAGLRPLLQLRLGILGRRPRADDQLRPVRLDEAGGRRQPAVQVKRADDRLQGVGEDARAAGAAGVPLAARGDDRRAELKPHRHLAQRRPADQRRMPLRQRALAVCGKAPVEQLGDDEAENAVAEELEPLVGDGGCRVGAARARVGQRQRQQRRIGEPVAQAGLHRRPAASLQPPLGLHGIPENSRLKRTVWNHSQTRNGLPSMEKKMNSARPTRFSSGT